MTKQITVEHVRNMGPLDLALLTGLPGNFFDDTYAELDEGEWEEFCEDYGHALGVPGCRPAEDRS